MHVPFYEGTCQNLLLGTLPTLEQLQSQITMGSDYRIDSNFVCLLYVVDNVPRAPCAHGHVHVPFYEGGS